MCKKEKGKEMEIKDEIKRLRESTGMQITLKRNASSATAELLFHF